MPENLSQILNDLPATVLGFIDGYQIITLAGLFVIGWLLQILLKRLLNKLAQRLPAATWAQDLITVIRRSTLSLVMLLLVSLGLELFLRFGWQTNLLALFQKLVGVWVAYAVIAAIIDVNLTSDKARFWSKQVLLPVALLVGVLRMFGLLQPILNWGFTIESIGWRLTVGSVFLALIILGLFLVLSRWVRSMLNRSFLPRAGIEPPLTTTISQIVAYVIIFSGLLIALNSIGIDLTTLTVIAGGLSVGLAFGLQEIFNNLISGFILLFERSIQPGDVVQVDDNIGIVQKIDIRSTMIKTPDNIELIIPNSYFLSQVVTNMTRSERLIRIRISVGVSYSANPREVEQALLEAAQKHPQVLTEPAPAVQFMDFGDSSLNFDLLVWIDQPIRKPALSSDLRYHIWDALAERHIEIPFPQRDIHIRSGVPWTDLVSNSQKKRE